jgi:hypothetical protein
MEQLVSSGHTCSRETEKHATCRSHDEVTFPVTRQQAVFDFGRTHVNTDHVGNLPASVCTARAGHTGAVAVAQAGNQLAAQFAARLSVDSRVDGFMRYVLGRISRIHAPKCARYLLRRPLPLELGGDQRYGGRRTALELALMHSQQESCSASVHGSVDGERPSIRAMALILTSCTRRLAMARRSSG